jgi:hypothetical protein
MKTETPRTDEWEIYLDNLPLAAALSFADEGSTTGGLLTHAALKTLAAGCRELAAVTEQRDRLAEALKGADECLEMANFSKYEYTRRMINEALAAVEGGSEKPVTLIHNGVGIADMYSPDEFENAVLRNDYRGTRKALPLHQHQTALGG